MPFDRFTFCIYLLSNIIVTARLSMWRTSPLPARAKERRDEKKNNGKRTFKLFSARLLPGADFFFSFFSGAGEKYYK